MKYNRVKETPNYKTVRVKLKDVIPDKKYTLNHIGCCQSKYGEMCYADMLGHGDKILRIVLPQRMFDYIDEMSHDDNKMRDIHDNKMKISFHPYKIDETKTSYEVSITNR